MIRRIERPPSFPPRRLGISRRNQRLEPVVEDFDFPELALRYSNGFVTVEITHDAVDAYVEENGDVPLPVHVDPQNGDRRTFDPKSRVRVVYDREAHLREVTTRGRDGQFVRLTVLPRAIAAAGPEGGGYEALDDVPDEERRDAGGDAFDHVVEEEDVEPQHTRDEDEPGAEEHGDEPRAEVAIEPGTVERTDGVGGDREPDQVAAGGGERSDEPCDAADVALEHRQPG
jgi:hypothetical protein